LVSEAEILGDVDPYDSRSAVFQIRDDTDMIKAELYCMDPKLYEIQGEEFPFNFHTLIPSNTTLLLGLSKFSPDESLITFETPFGEVRINILIADIETVP